MIVVVSFFILFLAALLSYFSVEACRRLAWRCDLLDKPLLEEHKKHLKAVPVLGGLGMFIALSFISLILLIFIYFSSYHFVELIKKSLFNEWLKLIILAIGGVGIFFIGLYDDFRPMKAKVKLFWQFILMSLVALYGFQISLFIDNAFINWLITVGWLVFIINAINFFDNMDGLAAGISFIAALFFMFIALIQGQYLITTLGALTCGVSWGFYRHNRSPAKIFMGDGGSHLLGYLLATLGGMVNYYNYFDTSYLAVLAPLFILALPIFDTLVVFIIRLLNGKPIFIGDHNHISHRFVAMGFKPKNAVLLIHTLQIIFCLIAIVSIQASLWTSVVIVTQAFFLFIFIVLLHINKDKNN